MLTGRCLCGGVRFELEEPPISARYCHCERCQRRTGTAASVSAQVVPGSLRVLSGENLAKDYDPGDGGHIKVFCSSCGSALWSRDPEHPERVAIRMGSFDGDPGVRPSARQFVAYAAVWEPIPNDGLPRFPERRPAQP